MRISDWISDVCSSDLLVARAIGETFPWGTMVVNITVAFGIGVLAALARRHGLLIFPEAWSIAATGLLGSYTTVSSFSLQTLALAREGEWLRAAGKIVLSLALCLGRSEEHTSELQSLMRISYAVFRLKKNRSVQDNNEHHVRSPLLDKNIQIQQKQ